LKGLSFETPLKWADMIDSIESNITMFAKWQECSNHFGVDDHGTLYIDILRQLGRSYRSFYIIYREYGGQAIQS